MKSFLACCAVALSVLCAASASATPAPIQTFNQCPAVGSASACADSFVLAPDNAASLLFDSSLSPVDGRDDALAGISNSTGFKISSLTLTGKGIGKLNGDADNKDEDKDKDKDKDKDEDDLKRPVPEPNSIALVGTGLLTLVGFLRRRMRP